MNPGFCFFLLKHCYTFLVASDKKAFITPLDEDTTEVNTQTLSMPTDFNSASYPSARLHYSSHFLLSQQPAGHVLHHSKHL